MRSHRHGRERTEEMKFAIVLCAVLGLSFGAVLPHGNQHPVLRHHGTRNLGDLLNELLEMVPVDKIIEIVTNYVENDPEVQEAVAYLKSDDFKNLIVKIQNMPQYMEYLEYLYNAGIDVYTYINYVHDLLGLPPVHRPGSLRRSTRSIMGMIHDILAVLPIEEMKAFYHEKVENDPDFQELLAKLKSPEFKKIVDEVRNMPEFQDMLTRLKNHGLDVDAIMKKINDFFGWGRFFLDPKGHLENLLNELLEMLPKEKINEIYNNYKQNDPEVKEIIAYMNSDEFKNWVVNFDESPQCKAFLEYMYNAGIDVYIYVTYFHGLLGLPPVPHPLNSSRSTRSFMGMIEDILAVLPVEEMKSYYHEKVENDPEFKELLAKLMAPEFKEVVDAVHNMPEFQDMMKRLKNHGLDMDAIQKKVNEFFGWERFSFHSNRNLGDLLNELLEMVPVDKIIEIVTNYVENDPEVQEAVAYLKSDDFKNLIVKIQNMPQYMEYLEYLYNAGIDVYTYINYVHDLLGLPPVHRPGSLRRSTRSIMGMIHDILAVLPIEEMKAFYHEKVENDPDFQELLAKLKSPEFKKIVDEVRNMPEFQDMLTRLKNHGLDVDAIMKKINDFFGWGRFSFHSKRNLGDLLNELTEMIPVDKIVEIYNNYKQNDPEVQEAIAYLMSDDFKNLVAKVENMPHYKEYLEYLDNAGIDVYTYINFFHSFLGLPPVPHPLNSRRSTRSIMGMIQDILAVLPVEEMKAFYHEKVENDPEFQELLAKLMSPEFKEVVDAVVNMPEYQDMIMRLKNHGVDVEAIEKKINDFFGW